MDSANDPTVQSTTLCWSSQSGKSEVINNVAGFFIDADPSPILMVQPTLEMAESWSKTRLAPMLRDCPCFQGKVKDARTRDSGNTVLSKLYLGGDIAIAGANSPAGLASRPRRVVLEDEIDRFPASAGSEGDPCALAERRTESFWNAVIFRSSTPTIKGLSRIEKDYEQTDKRMWFCPCPKCGQHQVLMWRQVLWGKARIESLVGRGKLTKEQAEPLLAQAPDDGTDAVIECQHCHEHLNDAERVKMVRSGEWRATAPFKGKRGYWLNGINSPFKAKKGYRTRLHQMVAQFLEAKAGGRLTLQAWTNTFLCETWEDEGGERIEPQGLMKRCEGYHSKNLPEQIILVAAGIDVQMDRIEAETVGVGMDDESWGIEAHQIFGDTESTQVWHDLAQFLAQSYTREDGVSLPITCAAIDMRHKTSQVRAFVRNSGLARIYPVYGIGGKQPLLVAPRFNKHYRLWTYAVSAHSAKDTLFARLRVETPGPRYMHFPKGHGYTDEYFAQLTAEVIKTHFVYGFPEQRYEKIRERNEALDRRVYFLAALDILKPRLDVIAKRLKQQAKVKEPQPTPEPPKQYDLKPIEPARREFSSPPRPLPSSRRRIRVGRW